jgi:hypothetical protein
MSYTNQRVLWSKIINQPNVDIYGDQTYGESSIEILARKQPKSELIKRSDGSDVISKTVYYIDPNQYPDALNIQRLDKLDSEIVEDIYIMVTLQGKPKMIRVYTT